MCFSKPDLSKYTAGKEGTYIYLRILTHKRRGLRRYSHFWGAINDPPGLQELRAKETVEILAYERCRFKWLKPDVICIKLYS